MPVWTTVEFWSDAWTFAFTVSLSNPLKSASAVDGKTSPTASTASASSLRDTYLTSFRHCRNEHLPVEPGPTGHEAWRKVRPGTSTGARTSVGRLTTDPSGARSRSGATSAKARRIAAIPDDPAPDAAAASAEAHARGPPAGWSGGSVPASPSPAVLPGRVSRRACVECGAEIVVNWGDPTPGRVGRCPLERCQAGHLVSCRGRPGGGGSAAAVEEPWLVVDPRRLRHNTGWRDSRREGHEHVPGGRRRLRR